MKIRRLEIQGFKSFADRTRFEFGEGISSIVGPNGCGKSNVVDAIKWVLGDMSPRSLRGKRMEDVIFAGSRHRRPVGLAEVSLVLENSDGLMRTERQEVEITRRLHRTGESEYLVSGQKARLKDIRELFLDTGLGVDGNAIMEQGQIDALLAANPQDRRGVFEEAAGVSRYKQRRKEADSRLRRTDENLERLLDVLELEEKRLRSLKNQAGRARRYQELKVELAKKRVLRAVVRYRAIRVERDAIQARLEEVLRDEQEAADELTQLEAKTREAEAERTEAREAVHGAETRIAEAAAEGRAATERASFLASSKEELGARIVQCREDARRSRARAGELDAECEALARELETAKAGMDEHDRRLSTAEAELSRLDGEVARIRDVHDGTKREVLRVLGRVSEARNEEAGHRALIRQLEERIGRLGRQRVQLLGRRGSVDKELDELLTAASRLEAEAREQADRQHAEEDRRAVLLEGLTEARANRDRLGVERTTKAARLDVLERLTAAGEGLAEGARTVLETVAAVEPDANGDRDGVLGVLADLVKAAPGQGAVLDRLLGPAAGALVTRTREDALRWIAWLKANHENAKARFLCLDLVRQDAPPLPEAVADLECGPGLAALVASVAAGTVLVEDLDAGVLHWQVTGGNAVTPSGDRVTASGALLGGADGQVLGLVERSAEMRTLASDVERLDGELQIARDLVHEVEVELERSESRIEAARRALSEHAEARSRGGEALSRVEKERAHLLTNLEVAGQEIEELEDELWQADEAASIANRRGAALEGDRRSLEARAEEAARGYLAAESARHQAGERRMEVRLALAEATARRESAQSRTERATQERRDLVERARSLETEASALVQRVAQAEVEIAESEARARRCEQERVQAADELVGARERLESLEQGATGEEARRREVHALHEDLRRRLEEFRLKDGELRVRIESLADQVRQDHELELDAVEGETAPTEDIDASEVEDEVEQLRHRLDGLGNVNLNAITELEEVQEHVDFLHTQQRDLLDAKGDLQKVISELDDLTTKRFAETFETVRVHFRETFRRLFGGGRADIVLEDASNLLESGVDIVARPPGKEQRTISLLSGGERTLTAVALLFAVFKAKPSPFAILDEVDAALDEANVRRLIGLVREFTDRSQFLVVTHAKTTMEAADVLYGITMEEPGVSKKVGVRLTEYPDEAVAAAS